MFQLNSSINNRCIAISIFQLHFTMLHLSLRNALVLYSKWTHEITSVGAGNQFIYVGGRTLLDNFLSYQFQEI